MGKAKIKMDAFKKKIKKTGVATIEVDGEVLSFPIKIKNELAMRDIVNYSDIKLLSLINPRNSELQATRAVKYANLPTHMKTLITSAEGFSMDQVEGTYLVIHDEKALEASANRRDFILNNVAIVCHVDFDYITEEETGKTYLDEINESLDTSLSSGDYISIVTTLYDEGILSSEVVHQIAVNAEAIRRNEDPKLTAQRFVARQLNMNEEIWLESLAKVDKEKEVNGLVVETEEAPLFIEPEEVKEPKKGTSKKSKTKKIDEINEEK